MSAVGVHRIISCAYCIRTVTATARLGFPGRDPNLRNIRALRAQKNSHPCNSTGGTPNPGRARSPPPIEVLAAGFFCAAQAADIPQLWAAREPEAESGPPQRYSLAKKELSMSSLAPPRPSLSGRTKSRSGRNTSSFGVYV
jgi:hypothetical protein